jgi:predicted ABC-type ATPase
MIVLAGPNSAGKSTLYETRIAPSFAGPFINAHIIQRDELRDPSAAASYQAAKIEPLRVCRRPFGVSYAAMADCSSMA